MLSRPFLIRLGGLVAACVLLWLFFVKWTPENQVRAKQEAFIEAASDKKWQKCRALMADSYSDRWGFNRDSARQALQDLGQRFLMLDVTFEEKSFEVADGTGTVKGKLTLEGNGPAASFVIPEVQRLKEPFAVDAPAPAGTFINGSIATPGAVVHNGGPIDGGVAVT